MTTKVPTSADGVREVVREAYGRIAREAATSCCGGSSGCGSGGASAQAARLGYAKEEIEAAPDGANLGLGCGNPTALAELEEGEVVLDLGAGAGFDALIAARKVGPSGRVIGVDMTRDMLARARANAVATGVQDRVEFREGVIEALPVVSGSVDVVISNCVVNLSPDKAAAFREAFRVLKPGGRLAVSDIVLDAPLPPALAELASAYTGCVAGAALATEYVRMLEDAGFTDVTIESAPAAPLLAGALEDPIAKAAIAAVGEEAALRAARVVRSAKIRARKP